ncbi:lipopolysaccharide kinase InaA family protein [Paludibacteraceae bacterium OttesenSCG-928-F17]|nr:lipopolysaccharide kinase InaA family protein [Paludibacteraceae bacterium OttesenSCG-928-F17]
MKIVINPKYKELTSFVENIPDTFTNKGELVYEARNQLKSYRVDGYDVIVKSFKRPHLLNRFVYSFFRPSKAKRSYEYAFELLKRDVPTPEPIAYIEEKKHGLLNRSYYISVFEKDYDHIRFYMNGDIKNDELIRQIAQFISEFHAKGVFHLDMSPGNILFKEENGNYIFSLIDINRMKFKDNLTEKERYESFKRLSFKGEVIEKLGKEYAKASNLNEEKTIKNIKQECAKFFKTNL